MLRLREVEPPREIGEDPIVTEPDDVRPMVELAKLAFEITPFPVSDAKEAAPVRESDVP